MAQPVRHAPPVQVTIPAIHVRSSLVGLGLAGDGTLQVPACYDQAGWYVDGPSPGDQGPAVIVGHVDSTTGPAVFYRLHELKRGASVQVRRSDGSTAAFTVDRAERVAKDRFPTDEVYGPTPRPELRLITCSGDFDARTGRYLDNLVVFFLSEQEATR